jgi:hypothetical protein
MAAWSEGALSATDAATVETHLATCNRCQEVLASFARTAPVSLPAPTFWQRWRLQWLVPIAAGATAVAIWVAVPRQTPEEILQQRATTPVQSLPSPARVQSQDQDAGPAETAKQFPRQDAAGNAQPKATRERDQSKEEERSAFADKSATADQIAAVPEAAPRQAAAPAAVAPPAAAPAPPVSGAARQEVASLRQAAEPVVTVSPNGTNFWRVVRGGGIERSTDRGRTWETAIVEDAGSVSLTGSSSPAETVCWFVGPGGRILLTTDGVRFRRVPFPENVDLAFVEASSATSAIVWTDGVRASDRRQFRTEDGGKTWQSVTR